MPDNIDETGFMSHKNIFSKKLGLQRNKIYFCTLIKDTHCS
jgi:hypothetical protein